MKAACMVAVAAALLMTSTAAATAPATTANHDKGVLVFTLDKKVNTLKSGLANRGIRARLSKGGFKITAYDAKCTRLSKIKLRCTYAFRHKLSDALGLSPDCGTSTVKLTSSRKGLAVGPTPTQSCS